jgi:HD-GYP domain-containing protein (c-di-GMP phosphodiesterase class II)
MVSERPYAEPMTFDEALDELRRNAGTQFDPHVVDVFSRKVEKFRGQPLQAAA